MHASIERVLKRPTDARAQWSILRVVCEGAIFALRDELVGKLQVFQTNGSGAFDIGCDIARGSRLPEGCGSTGRG